MANKKINELQSRVPSLTDLLLVGDPSSGYSYKCTVSELATIIETDISDNFVTLTTTQSISGAKTFSNILTLTSVANATTDPDKFLVLNASNVVNYRTGSEVLSDIGGQGALTLTTTGTSGAATLVGNTLNIPQYQTALTNPVTGTGTTNYLAKFTATSTIGNSIVFDNGTNVGIGGSSPAYKLDITGDIRSTIGAYFATSSGNIGIGTASPTGSGGPILHIKAGSIPEIHLTNSTTGDAYNDGFSLNVNGLNTYFTNYENGFLSFYTNNTERVRIAADGNVTFSQIANATTDTDRFLVSDSGVIKYRTGSELLSDIGGQAALTNPVTGSGTTNYIPKFTGTSAIGNSVMQESSTNIGIGITPAAKLDVSASSGTLLRAEIAGVAQLNIGNGGASTNYYDANTQIFRSGNGTENMRLTSTGLGIGTTSPSYKLSVLGSALANMISWTDNINNTGYLGIRSTAASIGADNNLVFETASSERMRITSGGNVGIGTTSPNFTAANRVTLDINGTSSSGLSLSSGGTSYGFLYVNSGAYVIGTGASSAAIPISFETSGSERMRITSGGNVGINTTTPTTYSLSGSHVENYGGSNYAFIHNNTATVKAFLASNESALLTALFTYSNHPLTFGTNNTERMRITSGGLVGIGTSSPSTTLQVTNTSGELFRLTNTTGSERLHFYTRNAATTSRIGSQNSSLELFGEDVGFNLVFGTSNTERMRIKSGGVINLSNVPSSATGLATGDIYRDGDGYLLIVL